jgi:lipoprotein-releasing system permease protein
MYKLILPIRYLLKRRISYLAVLAVALSVFIAFVVLTVLHGLVADFKRKTHDFVGDCVVTSKSLVGFAYYQDFVAELEQTGLVEAASPVVRSYALYSSSGSSEDSRDVQIMGVDPALHSRATGFGASLFHRRDQVPRAFAPVYDPNLAGCVFGIDEILNRNEDGKYEHYATPPQMKYDITCFPLTARGALLKGGTGGASTKVFHLSDTSHSGLARVDGKIVYVSLDQAQALCGMSGQTPRVNAIHIRFVPSVSVRDGTQQVTELWRQFKLDKADTSLSYLLDNVLVQDWKRFRRASIGAMEKEEAGIIFMFILVAITTAFIIFVVFYMIISHKRKDIGILKSVGVPGLGIVGVFGNFAALIGFFGSSGGLLGAWVFLKYINQLEDWLYDKVGFQLWDRTMFAMGDIPNTINPYVLLAVMGTALTVCLMGALIPTWQAARLRPIETLQVNRL